MALGRAASSPPPTATAGAAILARLAREVPLRCSGVMIVGVAFLALGCGGGTVVLRDGAAGDAGEWRDGATAADGGARDANPGEGGPGATPIFATSDAGQWRCVEGHARLNAPGASDGVFEFWVDGALQAARTDLAWRGTYTAYGINAVFFENCWNSGSPREQRRWFDDVAIATTRINCD